MQIGEPAPNTGGLTPPLGSVLRVVVTVQVPLPLLTTLTDTLVEPLPLLDDEDDTLQTPLTAGTISVVVVVWAMATPATRAADANMREDLMDFM